MQNLVLNPIMVNYLICSKIIRWCEARGNLSPLLFSIVLNDFERSLLKKSKGLNFVADLAYNHLQDEDTVT